MKLLKRFSLFEILLIATILGIHVYAVTSDAYNFPNTWFIRDDAYYYFKVAQNITQGLGSTFDGINPTNGYHPLWMLVCIPIFFLARFDLILPLRVLLMVIAIFNAATAVLIYRLVSRSLSNAVGMFAAGFWAFNGYIHYAFYRPGLETPLAALAIVLFIERLSAFESTWRTQPVTKRQLILLAALATIAMFSRLDLIFLAVIAGIYIIFRGHPLRYLLPFDIAIIFLSVTSSIALRVGFPDYNSYAASAVTATVLALAIKLVVFYFAGLYQHPKAQTLWNLILRAVIASTVGSVIFAGVMLLALQINLVEDFPRVSFPLDWFITLGLILIPRFSARWFGNDANVIASEAKQSPSLMKRLLHYVRNDTWQTWLTEGAIYYGIVGGALALYMLFNKIMFGTASPVSGQIKRWWGTLLHTVYDKPADNWHDFLGIGYGNAYNVWQPLTHIVEWFVPPLKPLFPGSNTEDERYYAVMLVFALALLLVLYLNRRRTLLAFSRMALIPLVTSGAVQTLSYTATAYGGAKEWYWISQLLLIVFITSIVFDFLLKPLQKYKPLRLALEVGAIMIGASWVLGLNTFIVVNMPHGISAPDKPYMEVVTYLEQNTPPHAIIGMTGGGNVGYFIKDRTIINMDGLINSYAYFQALQAKTARQYLYGHGMRIIFSNTRILTYPPYDGQFARYVSSFSAYGGKNLLWLLPQPKWQKP